MLSVNHFLHPYLRHLQNLDVPLIDFRQSPTQPNESDENPKIGSGPMSWAVPDWYVASFKPLSIWVSGQEEVILDHLRGENPYLSSFDKYRLTWELAANENAILMEKLLAELDGDFNWKGHKGIKKVIRLAEAVGKDLLPYVHKFLETGKLELRLVEIELTQYSSKHVRTKIYCLRSLLVESGMSVQTEMEDGYIVLNKKSRLVSDVVDFSQIAPQSAIFMSTSNSKVKDCEVELFEGRVFGANRASEPMVYVSIEPGKTYSLKVLGGRSLKIFYSAPKASQAFGFSLLEFAGEKIMVPGTLSMIFIHEASRCILTVGSREIHIFKDGSLSVSSASFMLHWHGNIARNQAACVEVIEQRFTLLTVDGRLLRISARGIEMFFLSMEDNLVNELIEISLGRSVTVNCPTEVEIKIAEDPLEKISLAGIFQGRKVKPTGMTGLANLRTFLALPDTAFEGLGFGNALSKIAVQKRVIKEISTAYERDHWGHAKVAAEISLLLELGWSPKILSINKGHSVDRTFRSSAKGKRFTPILRFDLSSNYWLSFDLPLGIKVKLPYDFSMFFILTPLFQDALVSGEDDHSPVAGNEVAVDFDNYEFSRAELSLLSSYASVLRSENVSS